jgi:hypothetical protein
VPAYLVDRKLQMAEEAAAREAAREAAMIPPGGGAGRRGLPRGRRAAAAG